MRKDKLVSEVLGDEAVLTPSDMYSQEFRRAIIGGYRPQEVDAFLERVADVVERINRRVAELKAQQEEARRMEETLRNALVTSQQLGENIIDSAKREAETLIAAAKAEKERMLLQAGKLPESLALEVARLREQRDRLRVEIQSILAAHAELLSAQTGGGETDRIEVAAAPPEIGLAQGDDEEGAV
ncbi:MAG: DivIVA domain-containing protein [Nitrospiraceae bacterium]|nr:DivIVA domain-containing protein [Nitrospiraceae bacterium]